MSIPEKNGQTGPEAGDPSGAGRPQASEPGVSQADLAQAFRDLAKGEQHAAVLERNLTSLEGKLDALLAQYEDDEKLMEEKALKPSEAEAGKEAKSEGEEAKQQPNVGDKDEHPPKPN